MVVVVNKYTLFISDPQIAKSYKLTFSNKIFITGIILSLIRIIRMIFGSFIDNANQDYILWIPEYDILRW